MYKKYLKTAIRNFLKNRNLFVINIIGLCLGITSALLIFMYVAYETSYDKFYPQSERIFRLTMEWITGDSEDKYCSVPGSFGLLLKNEYPEIQEVVRLRGVSSLVTHYSTLQYDQTKLFTDKIFYADSVYFKVFQHQFIRGAPINALTEPNTIVITESVAEKLFGNEDPINKTLQYDWNYQMNYARVTGVIKDMPVNTHLPFDALISFCSNDLPERYDEALIGAHLYTYFLLNNKDHVDLLENKLSLFCENHLKNRLDSLNANVSLNLGLQPIETIHLESDLIYEPFQNGSKMSVIILTITGFFLLIIATINYVILMTALSTSRFKEIAIRKIHGSSRIVLITQILVESVMLTLFATIVSLLFVQLLNPWINQFIGINLDFLNSNRLIVLLLLFIGSFILGLLSGLYPGIMISGFSPLSFIRDKRIVKAVKSGFVRKILVTFQIFITVSLIIASIIVTKQYRYALNKDIGINKENVIAFQVKDTLIINHLQAIKNDIKGIQGVNEVAASSNIPMEVLNSQLYSAINSDGTSVQFDASLLIVDGDFMNLMKMQNIFGEKFDSTRMNRENFAVIINETALKRIGWNSVEDGKRLCFGAYTGEQRPIDIIGVVKDFQWMSIHNEILPVVILPSEIPIQLRLYMFIRIVPESESKVLSSLNEYFKKYDLLTPVIFTMLEDRIASHYVSEKKMMTLLIIFSITIIVIASLGLLGLISFISNQKRKEFSIRIVFGANHSQNFWLVSKELITLIVIANIFSWPIAYYLMHKWLTNFAYRIDIKIYVFVIAFFISLLVTFATISFHLLRAVNENPVNSLKQE